MASREIIPYKTSRAVIYETPTDVSVKPHNPLDNTNDGATCTFKVFDHAKDEVLSALEAIGQTEWSVTNPGVFKVGDVVEIEQNDETIHPATLNAVDPSAGTVTGDTGLTVAASAGNQIRVKLGATVGMPEFGTAKNGEEDWGFKGTLTATHTGLKPDVEIDIELSFVGGDGKDALEVICAVIKRQEDCNV